MSDFSRRHSSGRSKDLHENTSKAWRECPKSAVSLLMPFHVHAFLMPLTLLRRRIFAGLPPPFPAGHCRALKPLYFASFSRSVFVRKCWAYRFREWNAKLFNKGMGNLAEVLSFSPLITTAETEGGLRKDYGTKVLALPFLRGEPSLHLWVSLPPFPIPFVKKNFPVQQDPQ